MTPEQFIALGALLGAITAREPYQLTLYRCIGAVFCLVGVWLMVMK